MSAETIIIYSQEYRHKGHAFSVWSYLSGPDPERSTILYAYRIEGVTVAGFPYRAEAVRKARQRIDELPAKEVEETPTADPPQASQGKQSPQSEIAQLREGAPTRPAQRTLFAP